MTFLAVARKQLEDNNVILSPLSIQSITYDKTNPQGQYTLSCLIENLPTGKSLRTFMSPS